MRQTAKAFFSHLCPMNSNKLIRLLNIKGPQNTDKFEEKTPLITEPDDKCR